MREATLSVTKPPRYNNKYLQCAEKVLHFITAIKSECKLKNQSGFDSKLLNLLENGSRFITPFLFQSWPEINPEITLTGTGYFLTVRRAQIFFPTFEEVAAA